MRAHFEHFSGAALIVVTVAAAVAGVALLARWPVDSTKSDRLILPLLIVALIAAFSQLPMLDLIWRNWRRQGRAVLLRLCFFVGDSRCRHPGRSRPSTADTVVRRPIVVTRGRRVVVPVQQARRCLRRVHHPEARRRGAATWDESVRHHVSGYLRAERTLLYPPGIVLEHVVQMPGGPGIARDVQCGYFYLPMSLLLAIPGYLLGDVRYSNLIALEIAGALIAFARPSRVSFLCRIVVVVSARESS